MRAPYTFITVICSGLCQFYSCIGVNSQRLYLLGQH